MVVDIEEDKMEVADPDLRRAINLTTEDLRSTTSSHLTTSLT